MKLKQALTEAMALAHEANRYLNLKEPWKQIKTDPVAAATSIFVALRVIDSLKTLLAPFLPFTCQRLHNYLGYDGDLFGRLYTEELSETERRHLALRYDGDTRNGPLGHPASWPRARLSASPAAALPQARTDRRGRRNRAHDLRALTTSRITMGRRISAGPLLFFLARHHPNSQFTCPVIHITILYEPHRQTNKTYNNLS